MGEWLGGPELIVGMTKKERWRYRRQTVQLPREKMFHWLALQGERLEIMGFRG